VARLLSVYGGRAAAIAELAVADPALAATLDPEGRYLAAEVVFAIREEFATTLEDIVFRRMMAGFDANQGRPVYNAIASHAATELGWSGDEVQSELQALTDYADSLQVGR
jgi:glycerol-3-phosphate dehydrogenase